MLRLPVLGIVFATLLTACGGGGSSSTPSAPANLTYSGSTSPATITAANEGALVSNVFGGATSANIMTGVAVSNTAHNSMRASIQALAKAARSAPAYASTGRVLAAGAVATIPATTIPGTSGGTMTLSGQIDNATFAGSMTMVFADYSNGIVKMNGTVSMSITTWDATNAVPLSSTITFSNIQITDVTSNMTNRMDGSFNLQISVGANTETITVNAVMEETHWGRQAKLQNFVMTNTYDNVIAPTTVSEVVTGRVFDGQEGYVDITTVAPMVTTNLTTDLYPSSGQIILSGANGALGGATKARMTVVLHQQVQIDIDLDGDGIYDWSAQQLWSTI